MAKYLFNGVELPRFPRVSASKYPYAVILYDNIAKMYLLGFHEMNLGCHDFGNGLSIYTGWGTEYCHYGFFPDSSTEWVAGEVSLTTDEEGLLLFTQYAPHFAWVWSNADICDMNGNVVFEGSGVEIVDDSGNVTEVTETTSDFLKSFLMGYDLGISGEPLPDGGCG